MNGPDVALWRLRNQRLIGEPFSRPQDAVAALGAVQSQDYAGAKWGLAQRGRGVTERAIDEAFDAGRIAAESRAITAAVHAYGAFVERRVVLNVRMSAP